MFEALGFVEISPIPYLVTIFAALAACVLILAVAALLDSDQDNIAVRLGQRARLWPTRMQRMLQRRGVDTGAYLGTLFVPEIRAQIDTCRACTRADLCDHALASRGAPTSHTNFTFCPNAPAIERYLKSRL